MGRRTKEQTKVDETIIRKNAGGEGNETKLAFATRLNDLIDQQVLRQSDLSKMTGIATGTISGYRNGDKEPTITNLRKIAQALDVSADYLIGLSNVRSPDIDTQAICKKIGCSEKVVNSLKILYKEFDLPDSGFLIELLNDFFAYENWGEFFAKLDQAVLSKKLYYNKQMYLGELTQKLSISENYVKCSSEPFYTVDEDERKGQRAIKNPLTIDREFCISEIERILCSLSELEDTSDAFLWRIQSQFHDMVDFLLKRHAGEGDQGDSYMKEAVAYLRRIMQVKQHANPNEQ